MVATAAGVPAVRAARAAMVRWAAVVPMVAVGLVRGNRADAPPCRGAWNPVVARSWNAPPHHLTAARSFWEAASDDCTCGYCEGRGLIKPEMALFNALSGFGVETHGTLIARTTGYRLREMSREGVWHTHNTSRVAEYLKTVV